VVDSLKDSVKDLEPPICPQCRKDMVWYQGRLQSVNPRVIIHSFICPSCNRTEESKVTVEGKPEIPPDKLSRPFRRFRRAA
jgi:transposase-like protein